MPLRRLTNREYKRRYKPWLTHGILNSIDRKNKLFNKYSKIKSTVHKQQIHDEYKTLRNNINELTRISKNNYYRSFFTEHNSNIKKVWQGIKEIVNITSKNYNTSSSIEINNSFYY